MSSRKVVWQVQSDACEEITRKATRAAHVRASLFRKHNSDIRGKALVVVQENGEWEVFHKGQLLMSGASGRTIPEKLGRVTWTVRSEMEGCVQRQVNSAQISIYRRMKLGRSLDKLNITIHIASDGSWHTEANGVIITKGKTRK